MGVGFVYCPSHDCNAIDPTRLARCYDCANFSTDWLVDMAVKVVVREGMWCKRMIEEEGELRNCTKGAWEWS